MEYLIIFKLSSGIGMLINEAKEKYRGVFEINVAEWVREKSPSLIRCNEGDLPLLNSSNLTCMWITFSHRQNVDMSICYQYVLRFNLLKNAESFWAGGSGKLKGCLNVLRVNVYSFLSVQKHWYKKMMAKMLKNNRNISIANTVNNVMS